MKHELFRCFVSSEVPGLTSTSHDATCHLFPYLPEFLAAGPFPHISRPDSSNHRVNRQQRRERLIGYKSACQIHAHLIADPCCLATLTRARIPLGNGSLRNCSPLQITLL